MTNRLWEDFVSFCRVQLENGDYDPVYPVLRELERSMGSNERLGFSLLYVAFYQLPSALRAAAGEKDWGALPTGVERRNLRGGKVPRHWHDLLAHRGAKTWRAWLQDGMIPTISDRGRLYNWRLLFERLQEPWGNGRWAAYKTGEILQLVHDFPVEPTDMGHAHSSGPRKGLQLFIRGLPTGNDPASISQLDQASTWLLGRLRDAEVDITMGQAETMLCNFHSLVHGDYYPGHDIDLLQEQAQPLLHSHPALFARLMAARAAALPSAWLGELHDRTGVDRTRNHAYRDHGELLTAW